MTTRSELTAIGVGAAVGVAVLAVTVATVPWITPGDAYPLWATAISDLGDAIVAVAPGFTAGYLAQRAGPFVGSVVGVLVIVGVAVLSSVLSWPVVVSSVEVGSSFLVTLVVNCTASAITNGVAGLAGEYYSSRQDPSNTSLSTDAQKARAG